MRWCGTKIALNRNSRAAVESECLYDGRRCWPELVGVSDALNRREMMENEKSKEEQERLVEGK